MLIGQMDELCDQMLGASTNDPDENYQLKKAIDEAHRLLNNDDPKRPFIDNTIRRYKRYLAMVNFDAWRKDIGMGIQSWLSNDNTDKMRVILANEIDEEILREVNKPRK